MKKLYSSFLLCALFIGSDLVAQTTYSTAVSDITLNCTGGSTTRTGIAYNPCFNLYYSVNAGTSTYPIETFSVTGGNALASNAGGADYRGLWWNNAANRLEGNTYNSAGVYSNTLNAIGYAQTTTSFISSATMPNAQSMGHANIPGGIIYYYDSGTLHRYNKTTNALISSTSISGLPAATSNLNTYSIVYTGIPGSDVAVYNYVSKVIYFINSTTAAYSASCALPSSAPGPSSYMIGFANNRFFLYNSTANQWYGYPISNAPPSSPPTASLTANSTLVCQGNPVNLTVSGAVSYSWSFGGSGTTAVVVPTANTVYSVTATSSVGCIGINTIAINIIPGAVVSVISTPTAICNGGTATLTSGGGVNSYTWNNSSNSQSIIVTPGSTTSYTVQGTNSQSCTTTGIITLTVNGSPPVLSIVSSTNQTCLGRTATLTASGALTYNWSNNVTNGASFTPSVTNTYTVLGQNGCGTTSAVTTITVSPLPVSIVSTPSVICAGSPATLIATSLATTYTWQPSGLTGTSIIVSPTVTTIYTVSVSDGTCAGITNLNLNALPVPTITSASSSTNVCAGYQVTLTASGGVNYTWTPIGVIGSTVVITPTTTALYSVVANNTLGCLGGSSQIIVTNSSPTLVTSASANLICLGDVAVLSVSGANTYTWDNNSNAPTITVSPVVSTNYTISGTTNSCTSIDIIPITVFIPSVTISGNVPVCNGNTISLLASGANSYTWNNGVQAAGITVAPNTNTTYVVTSLSATLGINCQSTNSVQVTVLTLPTVSVSISKNTICKFESTILNVTGAASYSWNTGATTASFAVTPTVITTINYSVVGTGTNGCENTASVSLKVNGCTGINELNKALNKLSIYPNPSTGNVSVEFSSAIDLKVINQFGQEIAVIQLNEDNNYKAKLQNLANGVYFIVGKNNDLKVTEKIIIQK